MDEFWKKPKVTREDMKLDRYLGEDVRVTFRDVAGRLHDASGTVLSEADRVFNDNG